ncbi:lytic murein transglycosylase B [Orbaceae bacterium ESL0727]|nr:lytic murein transglycosylase B [Orbaceae bacterium ESL0727]
MWPVLHTMADYGRIKNIGMSISLMLLLTACGSDNRNSNNPTTNPSLNSSNPTTRSLEDAHRGRTNIKGGFYLEPEHNIAQGRTLSANHEQFISRMVNKHGFDRQQLRNVLAQTNELDWVIRLMDKQAPKAGSTTVPNGAWIRYKNKFITPSNISKGVDFWNKYEAELNRAYQEYGVPPEIIVGIIGVETGWGRVMGKTRIIDALATLSFTYPRRADYFANELEDFLLMSRDEGVDPFELTGSFAGAMGYGQFMPSAFRNYAVDFNQNGHTDLWDPVDAIGSIANYFKSQGWQKRKTVAVMATGQAPSLDNGFNTKYSIDTLSSAGLKPQSSLEGYKEASLLRLDMGDRYQFWYGLPNFYVITRYNHSTHYAMAVWQLGEAVKNAR